MWQFYNIQLVFKLFFGCFQFFGLVPMSGPPPLLVQFRDTVSRYPRNSAVEMEGVSYTYVTLLQEAERMSTKLRELGVKQGDLVGLAFGRSFSHIVGILSAWIVGAAFLPLDPCYPADRVRCIMHEAAPRIILGPQSFLPEGIKVETENHSYWMHQNSAFRSGSGSESLAYIIFTSGSTGIPKGVMVSHRGLSILFEAQIKMFDLHSDVVFLLLSSYHPESRYLGCANWF